MKLIMYLLFSLLSVQAWTAPREKNENPQVRTITVTAKALVEYIPDIVIIEVGASLKSDDPIKLQKEIRSVTTNMISFARSLKVSSEDIATEKVSVRVADWEYDEDDCPRPPELPKYEATSSLQISLRHLESYDTLINGLFKNGATLLHDLSFRSSKIIDIKREARISAVRAAKNKAKYLSSELGQIIGQPLEVSEIQEVNYRVSANMNTLVVHTPITKAQALSSISLPKRSESASIKIVFSLENAPK